MNYSKKLLISAILICFLSCRNKDSKTPEFADQGSTINMLKSAYKCENIEFENWEDDDARDSTLTICLINSKSVPDIVEPDADIEQLKVIARQIKKSLKKPEMYKSYYVIFVKREGNFLFGSDAHTTGSDIPAKEL